MFYLNNADIIPGKSIGEFYLGMCFADIQKRVHDFKIEDGETCDILMCGDIRFWVDKEKDSCFQILVEGDFTGKYDNKIGLGTTLKDINKMGLEWYEDLDAYFIKGIDGICLELGDTEDDEEWDELSAPIETISVYAQK